MLIPLVGFKHIKIISKCPKKVIGGLDLKFYAAKCNFSVFGDRGIVSLIIRSSLVSGGGS